MKTDHEKHGMKHNGSHDKRDEEKKPDQEQQTGNAPSAEPKADEQKAM